MNDGRLPSSLSDRADRSFRRRPAATVPNRGDIRRGPKAKGDESASCHGDGSHPRGLSFKEATGDEAKRTEHHKRYEEAADDGRDLDYHCEDVTAGTVRKTLGESGKDCSLQWAIQGSNL